MLARLVRERPVLLERRFQVALDRVIFVGIALVLVEYFPLDLLFSVTTTTGGDTGAHIYTPWYLRNNLLPSGEISGWSPGWYGGFPMLHFYFPLVVLFQALASYLIPYEVAFKLGTILGTLFLPVAAYLMFRLMRFAWPAPALAAIASLGFLFMQSFSIYGGNIPSSLSGEYSYSLSLGLVLVFTGLMYRLAAEENGRPILAAGVLAMAVLSHLLPVVVVVLMTPLLLLWAVRTHGVRKAVRRFAGVYLLAFAISAFWGLPFLIRLPYTTDMRWIPLEGLAEIFPRELWLYVGGLVLASVVAFLRRDRRLVVLLNMGAVGVLLYLFLPAGSVWNGRFLPFFYLSAIIASAYFAAMAISALSRAISIRWMGAGALSLTLGLGLGMGTWLVNQRETSYIDNWIRDNYTGYESRPHFPTFKALNDRLSELPPGRVFWEPNDEQVKYGTPIALMSIPYWSGQPTLEGINYESSLTTPFHFITAGEVASMPANPIPGLPYQPLDLSRGARHMELLDVRYYLAFTQAAKDSARGAGMEKIDEIGDFSIFIVESPGQVVVPSSNPVPFDESGSKWVERNLDWFGDLGNLGEPLVRVSEQEWAEVAKLDPPAEAISIDADMADDEISFTTRSIGQPHWVKTSYFPNWKVNGAEGPYLASPSMMMVVPTQAEVRLYYARTWVEWVGQLLTLVALVSLAVPGTRRLIAGRMLGPALPGPALPGPDAAGSDAPGAAAGSKDDRDAAGQPD